MTTFIMSCFYLLSWTDNNFVYDTKTRNIDFVILVIVLDLKQFERE